MIPLSASSEESHLLLLTTESLNLKWVPNERLPNFSGL